MKNRRKFEKIKNKELMSNLLEDQVETKYQSKAEERSRRNFTSDIQMQKTWYKQLRPSAHISESKCIERSKSSQRDAMEIHEFMLGMKPTTESQISLPIAGRSNNFTAHTQIRMAPGRSRIAARCSSI